LKVLRDVGPERVSKKKNQMYKASTPRSSGQMTLAKEGLLRWPEKSSFPIKKNRSGCLLANKDRDLTQFIFSLAFSYGGFFRRREKKSLDKIKKKRRTRNALPPKKKGEEKRG